MRLQQLRLVGSSCQLSRCGARAWLHCRMWNLPGSGVEPTSPALVGKFPNAGPQGSLDVAISLGCADLTVPGSPRKKRQVGYATSTFRAQRKGLAGGTHVCVIWLQVGSDAKELGGIAWDKTMEREEESPSASPEQCCTECGHRRLTAWKEKNGKAKFI